MPQLVAQFAPSIPAGTAQASPVALAMNIPSRLVRAIRIRVPPGPAGQMGFQIGANGQQIIPETAGAFIVADDEIFNFDLIDFPEGGAYQLIGYNTGLYVHSIYVTFELDPIGPKAPTPQQPLPGIAAGSVPTNLPTAPATLPPVVPVIPPPPTEGAPPLPPITVPPVTVPPPPVF